LKHALKTRPKAPDGATQNLFSLALRTGHFRIWKAVRYFQDSLTRVIAQGKLKRIAPPAKNHQSRINCNARQPGGEFRPAVKAFYVNESPEETVLESVFGVLPVPGD
jgi:hypothetical protein